MTDDDLERLILGYLDDALDEADRERLADRLERDPAALSGFADQLQIHHRLGSALREETPAAAAALARSVVREIRFEGDSRRIAKAVVARLKGSRLERILRYAPAAAAACLLVMVGWLVFAPRESGGPLHPARPDALLVVGRLPLEPGDQAVRDRLERLGFSVTVRDAVKVETRDAEGRSLVAVSSSTLAEDLIEVPDEMWTKFSDVAVPVLCWEPRLFRDFGMTSGAEYGKDWGVAQDRSRLAISDPSHPLAAGLRGPVQVLRAPGAVSWGRLKATTPRIASLEGEPEKAVLFGYDRGAVMEGGMKAPARRVGTFLFDTAAPHLTPAGWRLFDAAVRWCMQP